MTGSPFEWKVTHEPEIGPTSVDTTQRWKLQDVYPMKRSSLPWPGEAPPVGEVPGWFTVVWVRAIDPKDDFLLEPDDTNGDDYDD